MGTNKIEGIGLTGNKYRLSVSDTWGRYAFIMVGLRPHAQCSAAPTSVYAGVFIR